MVIVHISTDYPDSYQPAKTRAIENLVLATSNDFDHLVYSLNRVPISPFSGLIRWSKDSWASGVVRHNRDDNVSSWIYAAPSNGIFLRSSLQDMGRVIITDLEQQGIKPDLVQGHKLTMEGIIAEIVARHFKIPYALSIQGNTDRSILNVRRDLWPLYRRIFQGAHIVFPFTPWALKYCEKALGQRSGPVFMLPCITHHDHIIKPQICAPRIMSAFHLRHWKIKNFKQLVDAATRIGPQISGFNLDIYGGGTPEIQAKLHHDIAKSGSNCVSLRGALPGDDMQAAMNGYAGFAMISKRETYGMVFAEALLAGCPIIYPQNAAVDGYFNNKSFALAVPSNDINAIIHAMKELIKNQKSIKNELAHWQASGDAHQFQRYAITEQYRSGLMQGLSSGADNAH